MITGPFSTGWRDEETEKARRSSRRWVAAGLLVVLASGACVWGGLGYLAGVL